MKTKRFGWGIGLAAIVLIVVGLVFSGASAAQWIPDSSEDGTWRVYVSHDLNGGHWGAVSIDPHVLTAPVGQSMPPGGLDQEKSIEPIKVNASFRGWSVRFTDSSNGNVIYDSGNEVWDLYHPFDYYPNNPRAMDCVMTARWAEGASSMGPETGTWTIHVNHDLKGGSLYNGTLPWPHTVITPVGQNVDMFVAFEFEMEHTPEKAGSTFGGWSVIFTDTATGDIVFDGRDSIWSLSEPFAYYPGNPREMDLLMIANWKSPVPEIVGGSNLWKVHNIFEIDADAQWGTYIPDFTIAAKIGDNMSWGSLDRAKNPNVFKPGYRFKGWSVRFTDAATGSVIYDSGDEIWDLDHPFDYYPGNPVEMNCRFLARWEEDPNARAEIDFWRIDIIYDLNGGHWGSEFEGLKQLMAPEWQSIPLDALKRIEPTREGYRFSGWSVRFSNPVNGYVIYDSGQEVWNLDVPFNYYPDNPPEMDCRFLARWVVDALPPDPDAESWSVIVSHDLNGGHWGAVSIDPHVLMAPVGQSMPSDGLDPEKSIEPVNEGASFRGWSVRFTDPANGSVIYDSGDEIWDLYHPFDYYPGNPRNMHCVMTARWGEASFPQPGPEDTWRVVISYDLNGGKWPPEGALSPRTITGVAGRSMPDGALDPERKIKPKHPYLKLARFKGWSVRFTDPANGSVIYDSGDEVWDLDHPFDYYSENPKEMDCLMIARWKEPRDGEWGVYIDVDLNGGFSDAQIFPVLVTAPIGESIPTEEIKKAADWAPRYDGLWFKGWSVRFTDPVTGNVIYDSGKHIWDLNEPFRYYPENPRVMECLMTARWSLLPVGK